MSVELIKCKHCSKVITEAEYIIGEPAGARQARTSQKLAIHIQKQATKEEEALRLARNHHKPDPPAPHAIAAMQANLTVMAITRYLIEGYFTLTEELEQSREVARHAIHEGTRKVRMSDEDLARYCYNSDRPNDLDEHKLADLTDLRDRYESLGKYAPPRPESANAPAALEVVKQ